MRNIFGIALSTSAAAISTVVPACAQERQTPAVAKPEAVEDQPQSELGDIIVTAQRRSESAQRVPISITVLGGDTLGRMQSGNEIGQYVPNVQIEQANGMGNTRTAIRGIAQGDFNPNATTSNMIYIDDVALNAPISQGVVIWDTERAEVLRGPQGTLFGRNATGGAIRYISAMPTGSWEGSADLTYGRFQQVQANFAAGGPLSDTLGIRLSYTGLRREGDVYNVIRREHQGDQAYDGVRAILDWQPSDAFRATLRAQYFRSDMQPMVWKSTPGLAALPGFGPLRDGRTIADLQRAYGFKNLGYSSNFRISENDAVPMERIRHFPISLNLDYDLGFATLTSVTANLRVDNSFINDSDASPMPMLNAYYISKGRQFTQELRLASDPGGDFNWILGGFYMNERMRSRLSWDATEWRGNVFFPNAATVLYTRGQHQKTESYAAFLHTTYQITPQLMLTAAARYTWENKDIDYIFRSQWDFPTDVPRTSQQFFDFKRAVETQNLGRLLAAAAPGISGKASWENLSWKVALDYQISPSSMVYALVSRGFKGGTFKPTANVPSEVRNPDGSILALRPEIVTDYEVGFKSDIIPGRLRVNAGAYYYDYKDYQTNQLLPKDAIQVLSNLPKARLVGAEIEMTAIPVDNLTFTFGAGVADTKITKSTDPNLIGNKLPYAENFNFNAALAYKLETGAGTFTPEVSVKYKGKYYAVKENDFAFGKFAIWNARIAYEAPDRDFYGSLWVKNLTDKRAVLTRDDNGTEFWGSDIAYVNQPRSYGITVGARF